MHKSLAALLGMAVFILALVSALWWWQSDLLEKQIAANQEGFGDVHFSYRSLRKTGFPFESAVVIEQPVFALTTSLHDQPLNIRLTYAEPIRIGKSLFTHTFHYRSQGEVASTTAIGSHSWGERYVSTGATECRLGFDVPWSVYLGRTRFTPMEWADRARHLDCTLPETTGYETKNNQMLLQKSASRLEATHRHVGDRRIFSLNFDNPSFQATPAYDDEMNTLIEILTGEKNAGSGLSQYGAIMVKLGGRYDGPARLTAASVNERMSLTLEPFIFQSALGNSDMRLALDHQPDQGQTQSSLNFDYKMNVTERGDAMTVRKIENFVQHAAAVGLVPPTAQITEPAAIMAVLQPAIPHYASLGTIHTALNTTYKGSTTDLKGTLAVDSLAFEVTPYGITGQGKFEFNGRQSRQAPGSARLLCRACGTLLSDLGMFAERVQTALTTIDARSLGMAGALPWKPLIENTTRGMQTLARLSKESSDADWVYAIDSANDGRITINGQPIQGVLSMLMGMPQTAPASPLVGR